MITLGVLRSNTIEEAANILANFGGPGEVPILANHHGLPVGWIRALMVDGTDVWYVGQVDDQVAAERVRANPVAISLEKIGYGVTPPSDEPGYMLPIPVAVAAESYRGRFGPGWTLTAVAMLRDGDRPAAVGSAMWAAES